MVSLENSQLLTNDRKESVCVDDLEQLTWHDVNPRPFPYGFPMVKSGEMVERGLLYPEQLIIWLSN
jgi:hypothetical protein